MNLIDGYWQCENCEAQYEDEDMNPDNLCENCSDEDDQWSCKWIELEPNKDCLEGFIP